MNVDSSFAIDYTIIVNFCQPTCYILLTFAAVSAGISRQFRAMAISGISCCILKELQKGLGRGADPMATPLILLGQLLQFGVRKDRAVLAHVFVADVTAAALADAALHAHLQ